MWTDSKTFNCSNISFKRIFPFAFLSKIVEILIEILRKSNFELKVGLSTDLTVVVGWIGNEVFVEVEGTLLLLVIVEMEEIFGKGVEVRDTTRDGNFAK